jgi:hypothetical protein
VKILFIAHTYLPTAKVGAYRVARLCRYLPEFGVTPIVLTVEEGVYPSHDDSFPAPQGLRVVRTRVMQTPLEIYARRRKQLASSAPAAPAALQAEEPAVSGWRRQALALLRIPDADWGWYRPATQAACELIRRESIDAIVSTGPPWTCHLVARYLKKKYRLPWLADFRDPWTIAVAHLARPAWRRWIDERLEASCLRWADRIICNRASLRRASSFISARCTASAALILFAGRWIPCAGEAKSTLPL